MVEASLVNTIEAVAVVIGILIALIQLRNMNRTRKTQLLIQLRQPLMDIEFQRNVIELMQMDFTSFDEFLAKYDSTVNPENYAKRARLWQYYDGIGYLLHEKLVDINSIYHILGGGGPEIAWSRWRKIIEGNRKRFNAPEQYMWFEYLVNEFKKMRVQRQLPESATDVWIKK